MMCLLSLATLSLFIYDGAAAALKDAAVNGQPLREDLCDEGAEVSMLQVGLDRGRGTGASDSQPAAAVADERAKDGEVAEKAAQPGTLSYYSPHDSTEWLEMAKLQAAAYFSFDVPGWTMLARMEVTPILSPDHLIIYAKDGVCALTFHGANDAVDHAEANNYTLVDRCGGGVHGGWWPELMNYLVDPRWESEFVPILTSSQCSHVYTVGHSMGGYLSGLFATCANMDDLVEVSPGMQAITVDKVYSFGAPAIAVNPPRNALSGSGCFDGARFYINDEFIADFAPPLYNGQGFKHPHLLPVALELYRGSELSYRSPGACSTVTATEVPISLDLMYENSTTLVLTGKELSWDLHMPQHYLTRMAEILNVTLFS